MKIQISPSKNGFKNKGKTTLDVVVNIDIPKNKATNTKRKPLNISLVMDRSGSMASAAKRTEFNNEKYIMPTPHTPLQPMTSNTNQIYGGYEKNPFYAEDNSKMHFVKKAVIKALELLEVNDRISIIAFDDEVEVVLKTTLFKDQQDEIIKQVNKISPRGSTNLHEGWVQGGKQIAQYLDPQHMNRIIILTDGQTNAGKQNVDAICSDVSTLKNKNISTSTLGVGLDFNEKLLQNMSESGDGNYYYIEEISQLEHLFITEFNALSNLFGNNVKLSLKENNGVKILDCYNDFKMENNKYILPNLVKGRSVDFVFSIEIDSKNVKQASLLELTLEWEIDGKLHSKKVSLNIPSLEKDEFKKIECNKEVEAKKAILVAARERDKALVSLNNGDYVGSQGFLRNASAILQAAPVMACVNNAFAETTRTISMSEKGEWENLKKAANYQNYNTRNSKD